jgi:hypothetical protein
VIESRWIQRDLKQVDNFFRQNPDLERLIMTISRKTFPGT